MMFVQEIKGNEMQQSRVFPSVRLFWEPEADSCRANISAVSLAAYLSLPDRDKALVCPASKLSLGLSGQHLQMQLSYLLPIGL